jgi:phasin family protein
MSKHKNRKMSNAVERVQQATKDQADATMASKQIQQATKDQRNATMTSANTLATSVQTIATAHADYAKKAMQDSSEFFAKLTSVKEPAKVMELHSEYVKNSYETFVAEAKKISELYTDFFKQTTKPLQDLIAKSKAG